MAVFLALPTCPCQLLEPLGIDFPHVHANASGNYISEGNPDYNGVIEFQTSSGESDEHLPVCQCHAGLGKLAEKCAMEILHAQPTISVLPVEVELSHTFCKAKAQCGSRAPPPNLPLCFGLSRTLTGVYRL